VRPFLVELERVYLRLKQAIIDVQACYQKSADAHRSAPPDIKVEDLVFILAKHIQTTRPFKKLSE